MAECDICRPSGNGSQQAFMYCTVDKQNFCINCLTIHQKIDSTSHHPLQCLLPADNYIPCLHHSEHEFYCRRHRETCCEQCKNTSHQDCKNSVESVTEVLQETEKLESQSKEMVRKLEKTKQDVDHASRQNAEREKDWIYRMQLELDKMNEAKNELEAKIGMKVDTIKRHMKKRREQIEQEKKDLQKAINEIEIQQKELNEPAASTALKVDKVVVLNECLKKHEKLLTSNNDECQMAFLKTMEHDFEAEHNVSATLHEFEETLKSMNTIYSEVQKYFNLTQIPADNNEIVPGSTGAERSNKFLRAETKDVSSRSQSEPAVSLIPTADTSSTYPKTEVLYGRRKRLCSTKSLEDYQQMVERKETDSTPSIPIQSHCQMIVRVPGDKTACGITGMARLDDGYLLLADYENTKLKVFAPCGDFKGELICEEKPRDMAEVENNKFLVNFPMAKKIHFVSVEGDSSNERRQIHLGKKIDTGAKCCGIAFQSNKIYVATQIPHQILIMNVDGHIEKTIKGENLFERATYIAVDPDSSLIYISDPNRKVVLGITPEKEEKFRYRVERPHGIVCAGNGMLFVADWSWEVGTIHLVNYKGERTGTLNIENCFCPQKLVYNSARNTLLITQWQKDTLTTVYLGDKPCITLT